MKSSQHMMISDMVKPVATRAAFSLVELSIVLVILGLLVGGVLAGQSLIRASELRAVGTEYNRWQTVTHAFRDKYFAIPGDMTNATSFWGKDNVKCSGDSGTAATPGTCNGNGDSKLDNAIAGANSTGENYRYWQHLALAGLIEGTYSGISGPINQWDMVAGSNTPFSKMADSSWGMREYVSNTGTGMFVIFAGNWLQFGKDGGGSDNGQAALKPEEAWNIDTKLDDGQPARGKIVSRFWTGNCTNATADTQLDTTYKLDTTAITCTLIFPQFVK